MTKAIWRLQSQGGASSFTYSTLIFCMTPTVCNWTPADTCSFDFFFLFLLSVFLYVVTSWSKSLSFILFTFLFSSEKFDVLDLLESLIKLCTWKKKNMLCFDCVAVSLQYLYIILCYFFYRKCKWTGQTLS